MILEQVDCVKIKKNDYIRQCFSTLTYLMSYSREPGAFLLLLLLLLHFIRKIFALTQNNFAQAILYILYYKQRKLTLTRLSYLLKITLGRRKYFPD
jgi:hypothetical protein